MMILSFGESVLIIAVVAVITFGLRAAPFILFGRTGTPPQVITYLGKALPPAVIGMLIVYCLKSVTVLKAPYGIPELIAVAAVAVLHLWRRNTLLSIMGGTVLYMVLVQTVFA